jgi:hypothetical protein
MEIIPLLHIKNKKIVKSNNDLSINIIELIKKYEENQIYILDHDGINKNKPNLCLLQKLSKKYNLWVDQGPKVFGDIVDSIIAGANKITIRTDLIKNNISNFKEIIENKIYLTIPLPFIEKINSNFISTNIDGYVLFDYFNSIRDFKYQDYLKNFLKTNVTYAYVKDMKYMTYLNKLNFKGFLIDIEQIMELKKHGI